MNIFLRELKANVKSLVIWSVIVALLIMIAVAKFSAFAGDPEILCGQKQGFIPAHRFKIDLARFQSADKSDIDRQTEK